MTSFFETQECCRCGVRFGVPSGYTANRQKDKELFYCPNGHGQSYKESEADRLRRERDRLQQQIAQRDDEIATKTRRIKKLEKRAAAGTCPCCHRTFSNMARHIKHKHPEFVADNVVKLKHAK